MAGSFKYIKTEKLKTGQVHLYLPGNLSISAEKFTIGLLLFFTFLIYSGALSNQFLIGWDDGEYLSNQVVSGNGPIQTAAIFSDFHLGMYQPLAVLSFAMNYKMAGDTAWPYILTNILLHLINTLLVYKLMKRWMKGVIPATVVALLFAIHPMHVEAVAWISTRSSGLYSFFFLSGLLAWDKYLDEGFKNKYYMLSLGFALLSLFSKSMAVSFPLILLLMDFYKGRKFSFRIIFEKIPFLIFSLIFGLIAVKAASSFGHITVLEHDYNWIERIFLVIYGISFYLIKSVIPTNLSAIYAFPEIVNGNLPNYVYSAAIVPLGIIAVVWFSGKNRREFITGILFFLASIAIVLPLFWSRIFITADRYSYIPYIGLFMIAGRLVSNIYDLKESIERNNRKMLIVSLLLITGLLSVATFKRVKTWKDTPTLLTDVIEKRRSDADMAHGYFYLANYYDAANRAEEALKYYDLALSRNQRYLLALNNRGILKAKAGNPLSAIHDFNDALKIKSDYAEAYYNRGVAYYQTGKSDLACEDWTMAYKLKFKPAGDAITQYCHKNIMPDFGKTEPGRPSL